MKATEDVQEGITDEDYDLFYEIWQVSFTQWLIECVSE